MREEFTCGQCVSTDSSAILLGTTQWVINQPCHVPDLHEGYNVQFLVEHSCSWSVMSICNVKIENDVLCHQLHRILLLFLPLSSESALKLMNSLGLRTVNGLFYTVITVLRSNWQRLFLLDMMKDLWWVMMSEFQRGRKNIEVYLIPDLFISSA